MYGNACNPMLRVVACTYQERVMKRDCETGRTIDEEDEEEEQKVQEQMEAEEQVASDSFFGQSASEQEEVCADPVDGQCQDWAMNSALATNSAGNVDYFCDGTINIL